MSVESVRSDLKAVMNSIGALSAVSTLQDVITQLQGNVMPFLESLVDEVGEIDGCISDLVEGAEDILQPETGEIFAAIIAGATAAAAAVRQRISKESDPMLWRAMDELDKNCRTGSAILGEIVIEASDEPEEEESDDEVDDEDEKASEQ